MGRDNASSWKSKHNVELAQRDQNTGTERQKVIKSSYFNEIKHSALLLTEPSNCTGSKMGVFALKSSREDVTLNGAVKINGALGCGNVLLIVWLWTLVGDRELHLLCEG